ncbi:MAG TPA: dihydroorotase [Thermodesulfobacteriota bacterium]|nr:dihydroorotase [Thermodesulfobacteriota bacterium]
MSARLRIVGGRLVDPASGLDEVADLLIEEGRIAAIGRGARGGQVPVLDATGLAVFPGLVDLHVHLREPGEEHKETIASGAAAAVAGGVTSVVCMADTVPPGDDPSVTEFVRRQAEAAGLARVYPVGAVTRRLEGEALAEYGYLKEAGAVALSDDGRPVMDSEVFRRALEYARAFDLVVVAHCEDLALSRGGAMHEGAVATELGLPGIPRAAEEIMVRRDLALAELTGARLHVAHVSTAGAVAAIREAKRRGVRVTAETAPHYFTLTDEAVRGYDTNAKTNPPLREAADREAVIEGLADGTIDAIASDHAPQHADDKRVEFAAAASGVVGLETELLLTLRLVREGRLPLRRALAALTCRPAEILGLPGGRLAEGAPADLVLVDLEAQTRVEASALRSRSRNSPFLGWTLPGRVERTLVGGRVVYERPGAGR